MFNFQKVKDIILERRLTQKEVCDAAGISVGTFYSFERIKGPRVDKLERLADVLHCRVDDFLDRNETKEKIMFNFEKLKDLILERRLTHKEVYEAAGIKRETFYSFKKTIAPNSGNLEKIADVLHCKIDDFFDREVESVSVNIGHKVRGNGNNVSGDISLSECKKEVEHLKELLAEKERTIQILMSRQK